MARHRWAIFDWAGNRLWKHGTFCTAECAWDFILGSMTDMLNLTEEDYQEYEVRETYGT